MNVIRGYFYRLIMIIAHKYHWHYAPPIYPEGDTQLWCKWCGFRQTIHKGNQRINELKAEVVVNKEIPDESSRELTSEMLFNKYGGCIIKESTIDNIIEDYENNHPEPRIGVSYDALVDYLIEARDYELQNIEQCQDKNSCGAGMAIGSLDRITAILGWITENKQTFSAPINDIRNIQKDI